MKIILKLSLVLLIISSLNSCNCGNNQGTPSPPTPAERVMIRTAEPFITVEIKEDENLIRVRTLDPVNHLDLVWYEGPFVPYTVSSGWNTRTFPVSYTPAGGTTDTKTFTVAYKTVALFQCAYDMSGENSTIQGRISFVGGSNTWDACGYLLP